DPSCRCYCWSRFSWRWARPSSASRRTEPMRAKHVLQLGVKELRGLVREPLLLVLVVYAFTLDVYTHATAMPEVLNRAAIAIVDEDASPLSRRVADAFLAPYFVPPSQIDLAQMDARMDAGIDTFSLVIPPDFQRDLLAGDRPEA